MRIGAVIAAIFVLAVSACGQSINSARTQGLVSVHSHREGSVFTWTVVNNTGPADGQPGWDVLVWTLQPFGIADPVSVVAPDGWEWTEKGFSRFLLEDSSEKYYSPPSIAPGASLTFIYDVGSDYDDSPELAFLAHVGAVLPQPMQTITGPKWIKTTADGETGWHDLATVNNSPEPQSILAILVWCAGLIGLSRKGKLTARGRKTS